MPEVQPQPEGHPWPKLGLSFLLIIIGVGASSLTFFFAFELSAIALAIWAASDVDKQRTGDPSSPKGKGGIKRVVPVSIVALFLMIQAGLAIIHGPSAPVEESNVRRHTSEAKQDMRQIAAALEAYRSGQGALPRQLYPDLTTPTPYVGMPLLDRFTKPRSPYQYRRVGEQWVIGSVGPDGVADPCWAAIGGAVNRDQNAEEASASIVQYDPTNGTASVGDIIFRKQD